MRRYLGSGLVLAALTLLSSTPTAHGCGYGVESPLTRFVRADYVFIGKVVALEEQTVKDKNQQEYRIAVVEVKDSLKDASGLAEIRVGFYVGDDVRKGAEGCFFVTQHPEMAFTIPSGGYDAPTWRGENFDRVIKPYRRLARLWEDPIAGLKAEDAEDRLVTAGLLLNHYRVVPTLAGERPTPFLGMNPEHARLILDVLLRADWSKSGPYRLSPVRLFQMLNPGARDGWEPPVQGFKDTNEMEKAVKTWIKSRARRHLITAESSN